MTFTAPECFVRDTEETNGFFFYKRESIGLGYASEDVPELSDDQNFFVYADTTHIEGFTGSLIIYTRIHDIKVQLMVFAGDLSEMDTDAIISNNLK